MSKFRPEDPDRSPEGVLAARPAVNMVPMSADEFARIRRQKFLKWGGIGLIAAMLLLAFVYRSTLPSAALNDYITAKKLYDDGKYSDALEAVDGATRDSARRVQAYQLRTSIHLALHQPKEAIADISRVIQLQPRAVENYRVRAQTYLELEDPANAAKDYSKLIELENSASAYNGRGLCNLKLNRNQEAIADFSKAIEQDASVEYYLQRGLALQRAGDFRKALSDLDHAIELRPDASPPYRARAEVKERLGDHQGADRDRQKATSMETPESPNPKQVTVPNRG